MLFFTGGPLEQEVEGVSPPTLAEMEAEILADEDADDAFADLPFDISSLSEWIRAELLAGREAPVSPLGTFRIIEKPGRPGHTPHTGERIEVPPRRLVQFSARSTTPSAMAGRKS